MVWWKIDSLQYLPKILLCKSDGCYQDVEKYGYYCRLCRKNKYKLYREKIVDHSTFNECGGVAVLKVSPIEPGRQLKCHHVYYGKYIGEGIGFEYNFYKNYRGHEKKRSLFNDELKPKPINHWDDVWKACISWNEGIDQKKYRGKLKRGIIKCDGNGIHAVVIDLNGNMFRINGSWG